MNRPLTTWLGWVNLAACLFLFGAMWALYTMIGSVPEELTSATRERWFGFAPMVAFPLIGALILAHRPGNRVGIVFAIVGLLSALAFFATPYAIYGLVLRPGALPLAVEMAVLRDVLWLPLMASFAIFPLIFPDGHPLSNRWKWLLWGILTAGTVIMLYSLVEAWARRGVDPFSTVEAGTEPPPLIVMLFLYFLLLSIPMGLVSLVLRWRRAQGVERLQLKWLILGAVVMVLVTGGLILPDVLVPGFSLPLVLEAPLTNLWFLSLPVAVGIAILRHRLYDIDILIRRTLQYTLLTGLLALMYFGGVVALQGIFGPLTGQTTSPLVTVVTTLGIAALFTPLRRRVQTFIDRRFYRRKLDAVNILGEFAVTARNEVELEKLAARLVAVVEETIQPDKVILWLQKSEPLKQRGH